MKRKRASARFTRTVAKRKSVASPDPLKHAALKKCPLCGEYVDEHVGHGYPCATCSVNDDDVFCAWCVSICEGCGDYYCYGCTGVSQCNECYTAFCEGCMGYGCPVCNGTNHCVECVAEYGGKCWRCATRCPDGRQE